MERTDILALMGGNCSPPGCCSPVCGEHASASEAGSDRSNRGQAAQNAGGGDGTDCGVTLGAPGRAEPIGHLAEDHGWPQTLLGHIVGWRHVTAGDEDGTACHGISRCRA